LTFTLETIKALNKSITETETNALDISLAIKAQESILSMKNEKNITNIQSYCINIFQFSLNTSTNMLQAKTNLMYYNTNNKNKEFMEWRLQAIEEAKVNSSNAKVFFKQFEKDTLTANKDKPFFISINNILSDVCVESENITSI
jgi:hypothetical protein